MPATLAMDIDDTRSTGRGYAFGQLAAALVTAATHEDAATRQRAGERLNRWYSVLAGMADGTLDVGSRAPVADLPAWVTLEVVRGGFATGEAAAGGPLRGHELEVIARVGLPASRGAVFAYYLSEPGMAELTGLLDSGGYRVDVPEQAALLTVAWLLNAGDHQDAAGLVETLLPFADRLCFVPVPVDRPAHDPEIVWRQTAGEIRSTLAARRPNPRIEAMREALTVWNPFADELLALWCQTADDTGRVGYEFPPGWKEQAVQLLDRYRRLAAVHTWCSKHRKPKENLAILRDALEKYVAGTGINLRSQRLLEHAVDSMVRRRGPVGSAPHQSVRARQGADAARPTHHALAGLVVQRLTSLPPEVGIGDVPAIVGPVQPAEAVESGLPARTAIPDPIHRKVRRAQAGTPEQLIGEGVVGSAEVLATLTPQLSASTVAISYPDVALQRLAVAHYRTFRERRSLLLLNLEHQVRIDELPWVQAVGGRREVSGTAQRQASQTLRRLGALTLNGFPATVLPNPMITELAELSKQAGIEVPWVEELAADIFMGTFSAKFLEAAKIAADLLRGTVYERYYGIDYPAIASDGFDSVCHHRAGATTGRYSVAANGMVIEQAQILTTHNLATLVGRCGVTPADSWEALAARCLNRTVLLASRLNNNPQPLRTVKDVAYAWRHMLFFLSLTAPAAQRRFAAEAHTLLPEHLRRSLLPAVEGLDHVINGGVFDATGAAGDARRLLGWTTERHWILE